MFEICGNEKRICCRIGLAVNSKKIHPRYPGSFVPVFLVVGAIAALTKSGSVEANLTKYG